MLLSDIDEVTGQLPLINILRERHHATGFFFKGFPSAAGGRDLLAASAAWAQDMPDSNRFQLHLNQDFSSETSAASQVEGFSGSGIFFTDGSYLYLVGLFTRFLEAGKVIYGQYLATVNE